MGVPSVPVEIGEMLAGKYRVERILGHGGMGVVVAATHVQLNQHVAIKFLLPDALANSDVVARFQREARAAVKIQSEHVARVIDVGTLESGAPYMVMEYLEGADLSQKIASSGAVTVHEAVRYLLEACEALAEAHHAGIVHRDLKPANLFLARRADKTSIVKVLDFGISKSSVGGGGGITSTQAVMGSPYYMSPEQLMSAKHVDARSDIWSLGIVLHEALVGVPPYSGESIAEIVAQILQAPAPSVRAKRPDVPPEIDRIIATCLAKDPNARYRDVGALARDLAGLIPDGTRSMDRIARVLGTSVSPPVMQTAQTLPLSASGSGSVTPLTPIPDVRGGTVAMQRFGLDLAPSRSLGSDQRRAAEALEHASHRRGHRRRRAARWYRAHGHARSQEGAQSGDADRGGHHGARAHERCKAGPPPGRHHAARSAELRSDDSATPRTRARGCRQQDRRHGANADDPWRHEARGDRGCCFSTGDDQSDNAHPSSACHADAQRPRYGHQVAGFSGARRFVRCRRGSRGRTTLPRGTRRAIGPSRGEAFVHDSAATSLATIFYNSRAKLGSQGISAFVTSGLSFEG